MSGTCLLWGREEGMWNVLGCKVSAGGSQEFVLMLVGPNSKVTLEGLMVQTGFPRQICFHGLKWNEGRCIRAIRLAVINNPEISGAQHNKGVFFTHVIVR